MQIISSRLTASVLMLIGLLALLVLVANYNSRTAAAVGYTSNSQPTLSVSG